MNGYGSHTFKTVNADGEAFYVKWHFKTSQGIKNLTVAAADKIASSDPDYSIRDLYNAIASGDYPEWKVCIQVMSFDEAEKADFNPFDVTKVEFLFLYDTSTIIRHSSSRLKEVVNEVCITS